MNHIKIKELIDFLTKQNYSFNVSGDCESVVTGFSSLTNYREGCLTWKKSDAVSVDPKKKVRCAIIQEGVAMEADVIITSPNSKSIFFALLEHFWGSSEADVGIGKGTVVGNNVILGKNIKIGNNCTIIGDIKIGEGTQIGDNVVIRNRVSIGANCVIQSLTVIGEDGFGYSEDSRHRKTMVKHYGGVKIGDDVFIGSHVNIARGTIDDTVIGHGVKIAPTTHIGHNNLIGDNATVICSQLFGSAKTGSNAYITSSVVRNQCTVGDNTLIGMGSVVTKDIESDKVAIGIPAVAIRENR